METGVLLRQRLENVLPFNDYYEYYGTQSMVPLVVLFARAFTILWYVRFRSGLPPSRSQ